MSVTLLIVIAIILVALTFDFINGFHDAANSIATVVSTRVLSPRTAVVWAAFFNFVAAFTFGTAVAKTMGTGMIRLQDVTQSVIVAGLLGAIAWDLFTWYFGLPVSSSHALIGGYAGAAIARAGFGVIIPRGWTKTLAFIVLAPTLGLILGFLLMLAVSWMFYQYPPRKIDVWFRRLQLCSAAIPFWVVLLAHAAIALGTLTGGWRIVHTMGSKITKLRPVGGFSAETAGAVTILTAAHFGIPVSTTHTITGAIVGVGSLQRLSAVRWGVAARIVWAWVLTIPASAAVAAGVFLLIRALFPNA
jgi:PiT family inorganic phosphate transporter